MASNRQVISVSRRTDIPALYAEWFMHRLEQGFACYRNPFGGTLHEVSLKPEDVLAVVFWSRNYAPLLPYLPEFDRCGYGAYFQCTITGYGAPFERAGRLDSLYTCESIEQYRNVIFLGEKWTGKTHLATSPGIERRNALLFYNEAICSLNQSFQQKLDGNSSCVIVDMCVGNQIIKDRLCRHPASITVVCMALSCSVICWPAVSSGSLAPNCRRRCAGSANFTSCWACHCSVPCCCFAVEGG